MAWGVKASLYIDSAPDPFLGRCLKISVNKCSGRKSGLAIQDYVRVTHFQWLLLPKIKSFEFLVKLPKVKG